MVLYLQNDFPAITVQDTVMTEVTGTGEEGGKDGVGGEGETSWTHHQVQLKLILMQGCLRLQSKMSIP